MWRSCVVNRRMNYDIVEMIIRKRETLRIFKFPLKRSEIIFPYTCIQVANRNVGKPKLFKDILVN